jgi:soluble lytic murein transglycosylase-like protein
MRLSFSHALILNKNSHLWKETNSGATLKFRWPALIVVAYLLVFPVKIHNFTINPGPALTASQVSAFDVTANINVAKENKYEAITVDLPEAPKKQPASIMADASRPDHNSQGKQFASPFDPLILQAAKLHQVDPALIKAVIMAESGYNPKALSKKGAQGLMQLMPRTAQWLGVIDSFNPEHNINGGAKYLKQLLRRFDGDVELALAAYNAGSRHVRRYNGVPPFKATKFYISKVFKYYDIYKNHFQNAPFLPISASEKNLDPQNT